MEPHVPTHHVSPGVNNPTDSSSASKTFANVLALLDKERSRQLVQQVVPAVTYTGSFEVVGRDDGLDPPTELCSPCKRLFQQPPPLYSWKDLEDYEVFPPAQFWIPHHDTLFQLIDCCFSRVGSCRLCQLLWHGIRRETLRHRLSETENSRIEWHEGGLKVAVHNYNNLTYCIGLNIILEPLRGLCKNFYVRMVHRHSTKAVKFHPLMEESTNSTSTFRQIKQWLDHCLENHSLCQIPDPSESDRPTRLIMFDYTAGTFRLTTDFASNAKYAAVSYRWGSEEGCYMLTQETADRMRQGVPMDILPKTIFDTCTIAHHLGLKHVWIDRLCIFQDSLEDWSQEASRMACIYKHAFLTISATCASHENQGCFRKRNVAGIQPLRLISNPLVPSSPAAGFYETSYITSDEPEEDQKEDGKLGHLADRGWVFQERVLSQRIVHFAQEEVYWECRELEASEAWPEHTESFLTPRRPSVLYGPGTKNWNKESLWHEVVREYSARQLTYDGDKLPALSGLARQTADLRSDDKDVYLAGIWRSTVHSDLCWSDYYDTPRIPEEYLAPSWSWASLHARISHTAGGSGFGYRPVVKFKDARLKFSTADTYGAVHDGWIHLFGRLKQVTVFQRQTQSQRREAWPMMVCGVDGDPLPFLEYPFATLDIESFAMDSSNSVPIFCMPVLKDSEEEDIYKSKLSCLLLVPNGSIKHTRPGGNFIKSTRSGGILASPKTHYADEYQRAGLARITVKNNDGYKAWLEECPKRDIVIR